MRKPPDIPPPETITHRQLDLIAQTREYQLITPLYGGGVTPGEADPVTIIRATEIRGHLRFWWRATRGGQFGDDVAAMQKREGEIWGKAYQKEKKKQAGEQTQKENDAPGLTVQIEVDILSPGESKKPF
ncbi:MAG TPA: type III-B CRISPR module RAMP protein Cmr1, partial [Ktedonobacteraceae bacterium]|nr:type III-B CRISPR module RAMP protein Cmr1 [Ktedonobacteraceae bacterium]